MEIFEEEKVNLKSCCTSSFSTLEYVKQLYLEEVEEARLKYNSKQSRPSRMIDNYFDNVSNNEKKNLACEILSSYYIGVIAVVV